MRKGTLNNHALFNLTRDGWLLFLTRFARLFAYGALSVVLVLYLTGLGLSTYQTGILLTLTLVGDTFVSLLLTTQADRFGRRRVLIIGALLMVGAGLTFAFTGNLLLLLIAGTVPTKNLIRPENTRIEAVLSEVDVAICDLGL